MIDPHLIYGFRIYVDDALCVETKFIQVKFPRSKKSRIRKKWRKNRANFGLREEHKAFQFGDRLILSSKLYNKLKNRSTSIK